MEYFHDNFYNYMLTQKCACGSEGEMLGAFMGAGYLARCKKCHLTTHAYKKREDAAKHWNDGDDIMPNPLHIFFDDPQAYMQGEVVAIHIADQPFDPAAQQYIEFHEAIIEYPTKIYWIAFHDYNGEFTIDWNTYSPQDTFDAAYYPHTFYPAHGTTLRFKKVVLSYGEISSLEYDYGGTPIFIAAGQDRLYLSRDYIPERAFMRRSGPPICL